MSGQQQHRPLGAAAAGSSASAATGGSSGAPTTLGRSGSLRGPNLARTSTSSHSRAGSLVGTASGTLDDASIAAAQELASIMNQPAAAPTSWLGAWPWAQALVAEDYDAPPPPLPPGTLPEVTISDFSRYLRSVGERLEVLERSREASQQRMQEALSPEELKASQGQGLVAAMAEVPAPFFQEGFDIDQAALWEQVVQVHSEEARQESLERLSGWLDVVETHLVREIAARTDSFFDGSGYIQDVRGTCARLYQQVSGLRQQVHGLEQEVAAAVDTSARLQRQRANLTATLDVLRGMEGVAQAQSALQGLLPQGGGIAADYAGAIDVLEVLQGVLDDEALLALDCFKHLPGQIVQTGQAVDDLMATDFLDRARFAAEAVALGGILDRLRLQVASGAATPRRRRRASSSSSLPPSRQLSAEESAELADLAELRLADGAAVERVAGWLERLAAGAGEAAAAAMAGSGDLAAAAAAAAASTEAAQEELQEVLLPLVIGLRRMGRLPAVLRQHKETSVARLKDFLSQVIEGCLGILDGEGAQGDSVHLLASHRSPSPPREPVSIAERLQRLPGQDFQWVLEAVLLAAKVYLDHCAAVGAAIEAILAAAKATKQQLSSAARDTRECCQAVAEAAAGRWSKLLGSRARGGEGGGAGGIIRLAELQGVLELTDVLAALVEQYGSGAGASGRGVLGLRPALQQLCKAALDGLHRRSLGKLTTLLEQEQWSAVEVPPQFQQIADELQERGGGPADGPAAGSQAAAAAEGSGALSSSMGAADGVGTGTAQPGMEGGSRGSGDGGSAAAAPGGVPRKYTITPHDGPGSAAEAGAAAGLPPPPTQQQAQQAAAANGTGSGPAEPAMTLLVAGQRYHVVNTQLLLLSMLREYATFRDAVPAFAAEAAQRVLELLKVFNSRTCQLVLGAGAMQVSGLKSITAKHLALSCQCLGAFMALHPALAALFTQGVLPPRRDMLLADFGRALQDYRIHHEEVCSKLVAIMRERLSANIKQLPALAAAWPAGPTRAEAPAPSSFATTAAKQLQILSGALSPLLLPSELHSIFGRIGLMFSRTLAEAYDLLEPHGPAWEQQLRADMQFLLNCLRNLPMDPAERDANLAALTQQFETRFLGLPARAPTPRAAAPAAPAAAPAATVSVEPPAQQQPEEARQQQAAAAAAAVPTVEAPAAIAAEAAAEPGAAAALAVQQQHVPDDAAAAAAAAGEQDVQQPGAPVGEQPLAEVAAAAAVPSSPCSTELLAAASGSQEAEEQAAGELPLEQPPLGAALPLQPLPPLREQQLEAQDSKASSVGDMLRSQSGLPEELEEDEEGLPAAEQQQPAAVSDAQGPEQQPQAALVGRSSDDDLL